jgi:catechol 2,3-dioxygenase-like lactoylglutathione lyase family enzyme
MSLKKHATPTTRYLTRAVEGIVLVLAVILTTGCNPKTPETDGPRFNHVMLYVSDLDESVRFYGNAFGMRLDQKLDHLMVENDTGMYDTLAVNMAFLRLSGSRFVLELSQRAVNQDSNAVPLHFQHLGIEVDDIELAMKKAGAAGAETLRTLTTVKAEGIKARNAFFKGPDGEIIELMEMLEGAF